MLPFKRTYSPATASTNGFVAAGSGAALTLAATSAGDGLAHLVSIATTTDQTGKTFAIVGTGPDGEAQTETVTGPNNTTVNSTKYFLTIASITPSATLGASTVNIGWAALISTPTYPFNRHYAEGSLRVVVTGTINYTVQETFTPMGSPPFEWSNFTDANLVAATATQVSNLDKPVSALRIITTSYSASAALDLYIVQARV